MRVRVRNTNATAGLGPTQALCTWPIWSYSSRSASWARASPTRALCTCAASAFKTPAQHDNHQMGHHLDFAGSCSVHRACWGPTGAWVRRSKQTRLDCHPPKYFDGTQHTGLRRLVTLNLARASITDAGLAELASPRGPSKLRALDLGNCAAITDAGAVYAPRAVQSHPDGGQSDFVWPPAREPHVGPRYVWCQTA